MTTKMFFAGSGGQGVLLMGQMIAKAAMYEGKEVTFLPSYGPEMRGGTANCTVVVSDSPISCPLIYEADTVIAMNLPSLNKFESLVKKGGQLFINSTLVNADTTRTDVDFIKIPANAEAIKLGNERTANIIMLGAVVSATKVVKMESIEHVLETVFSGPKAKLLPLNKQALTVCAK